MFIYLDNAATTFKKPLKTYLELVKSLTFYNANPSRGSHKQSIKAGLKVYDCREHIKNFFKAPKESNVVYTYNCTEAINYALTGTLNNNDHVISTVYNHNAVTRTLYNLEKTKNIKQSVAQPNSYGYITIKEIKNLVNKNTKLIVITHTSNVTGTTTNLSEIGNYCKKHNIIFMVDCAQSAGHEHINVEENNINLLCIAGHKGLYGTQGIGALIVNNCSPSPIKFGGSGSDSRSPLMPSYYPEKLEAGTINLPGIMALDGGISFVEKNFNKIQEKTIKLTSLLLNFLRSNNNFMIYTSKPNSGVISFNLKNKTTQEVVDYLNQNNVYVRGGLHCTPQTHTFLNTLNSGGTVRVSISYFNTTKQIKKLINLLKKIAWLFQAIFMF